MAYTVLTDDYLTKWWITGTGSVVNHLSEVMDDQPLGPCMQQLDADDAWGTEETNEWLIFTRYKPDSVYEYRDSAWNLLTNVADNTAPGALGQGEWTFYTDWYTVVRLTDNDNPNDTDMREYYAWDGSGAGLKFMTESIDDGLYQIHISFDIGDGTTPTILTLLNNLVWFDDSVIYITLDNATFLASCSCISIYPSGGSRHIEFHHAEGAKNKQIGIGIS